VAGGVENMLGGFTFLLVISLLLIQYVGLFSVASDYNFGWEGYTHISISYDCLFFLVCFCYVLVCSLVRSVFGQS
jgi:hypothetical protein